MIHDVAAERAVIGVVLNTRHGVGHVAAVLKPVDFYVPTMGNLYAAALAMCDVVSLDERIGFATAFTEYDEALLRTLIRESPVQFNATCWAKRVAECSARRAAMHRCIATYEALRDGADVDEAMAWS